MSGAAASAITLRALDGEPLRDEAVRDVVAATARAIAERQGIAVRRVRTAGDRITVELECPRIAAIGFAAELRRLTTDWYTRKYGAPTLWGDPRRDGDDADDAGEGWRGS